MISRIRSHWLEVLILLAALALGLGFRLQALDLPLDRDEGTYGYIGANLGSGLVPYRDAFDHKPPVIYFVYAIVDGLGEDNRLNTRAVGAVVMALTTLLVYGLGRRIYGPAVGLAAAFFYALLGNSAHVQGPHLNAEHVMLPILLISMLAAVEAGQRGLGRLSMLAGMTATLAILAKPVAIPAVLPIFVAATIPDLRNWRAARVPAAWFMAGSLVPVAAFGLWFLANGAIDDFYRSVFAFNTNYVGGSFADQWELLLAFGPIVSPLTLIALAGALVRPSGSQGLPKFHYLFLAWAVATVLTTKIASPYPVMHYFVTVMPVVAILAAAASVAVWRAARKSSAPARWAMPLAVAVAILAATWWHLNENLDFYFRKSLEQKIALEFAEQGPEAFLAAESVAKYVNSITDQHEEILVWAGEAEVYFLADRKSATRYINTGNSFPERERTVREDVVTKRPRVVVAYNDRAGVLSNPHVAPFLTALGYERTLERGWLTVFELPE